MQNPFPANLMTRDAVQANGWLAEAREGDLHSLPRPAFASPRADDPQSGLMPNAGDRTCVQPRPTPPRRHNAAPDRNPR